MIKPIVKSFWRNENPLALIASAKFRLREACMHEQANLLSQDTEGKTLTWSEAREVVSKYCDIR